MGKDKEAGINKKSHGVHMASEWKPESKLNLEGNHANGVKAHKIGEKVQMVVTGSKQSHNMGADGNHSASYKIHSVKMMDKDDVSGPNTKGAKNDEDASDSHQ